MLNIFAPLQNCQPIRICKCVWNTNTIRHLRKRKRNLWQKYRLAPSVDNLRLFRSVRNQLTTAQRNAQAQYENNIAAQCATNPRAFFRYASSRLKTRSRIPRLALPTGGTTQDTLATAAALNNYFASVFTSTNIQTGQCTNTCLQPGQYNFDEQGVQIRLLQLSENKASRPDGITNQVLKRSGKVIAPCLTSLFQLSLDSGTVPDEWKDAHVTTIHKSGRFDLPENYRPISLLSCTSKVMERYVYDWLTDYLSKYSPLKTSQHGFQRAQSCTSQLLEYVNDITLSLDQGLCVDVIYLDFNKAFD